jgi:DNA helicase HerA-like ATPase
VSAFRLPGAADRTVVIGATGSGKTTFAAWLLSRQRLDRRPWVILDYKREELWDRVGRATIRPLRINQMPGKVGLYRIEIDPGQDDPIEDWLWRIRRRGNVGLFCDEAANLPTRGAFKAILRQGRSLRLPVISCTQRPVDVDREIFSESGFKSVFRLEDERDYLIIRGMTRRSAIDKPLPEFWSYWYDAAKSRLLILRPAPDPDSVAAELRAAAPSYALFGV